MDLPTASISYNSRILSRHSILTPKIHFRAYKRRHPQTHQNFPSKSLLKPSISASTCFYKPTSLHISAQFSRRSKRRNYLKKKLLDDQQVRPNLTTRYPFHDFDDINDKSVEHRNYVSGSGLESGDLGDSELWNKLENWVHRYSKDIELWGSGSGPIFTVFVDSDGNVNRVRVNEDEILKRCGGDENLDELKLRVLRAKSMAGEIERGEYELPRNSTLAKFVVSSDKLGFLGGIQSVVQQPGLLFKVSRVGLMVLCGLIAFWSLKRLLGVGEEKAELTRLEKEMLRRKIKARKEKESLEKGSVEVLQNSPIPSWLSGERPHINKEVLTNSILKAKEFSDKLTLQDSASMGTNVSTNLGDKIAKIREMARRARETEAQNNVAVDSGNDDQVLEREKEIVNEEMYDETEVNIQDVDKGVKILNNHLNGDLDQILDPNAITETTNQVSRADGCGSFEEAASVENIDLLVSSSFSSVNVLDNAPKSSSDPKGSEITLNLSGGIKTSDINSSQSSSSAKSRIILSVKEAREYLSQKSDKQKHADKPQAERAQKGADVTNLPCGKGGNEVHGLENNHDVAVPFNSGELSNSAVSTSESKNSGLKEEFASAVIKDLESSADDYRENDINLAGASQDSEDNAGIADTGTTLVKENWMEKNFHKFEPIVQKISAGFKDGYMIAREKVKESNIGSELTRLFSNEDDAEFEWMKDDRLRDIVFKVRDNELAGRDPFYMMKSDDKNAFFEGLEKKVEKENEKLANLHDWLHSNIENLDYGADGISLYDPPEKVIPRWKGSSNGPEFLKNLVAVENAKPSYPVKKNEEHSLQKPGESLVLEHVPSSSAAYDPKNKFQNVSLKESKTFIESSDGSIRPGKKSGKEYWQHTKKWSRGFLESYNATTDPELKSVMRDMGKDLDRWITEKEIQEAAKLMDKIPVKGRKFIEKKVSKLKREMELFGPQAVVSKYSEYAEEKEEDYLWWLDLPFVLGIELYTTEDGKQKIGFYSLEMAPDLELEPKQYHVIAFEDAGDCKNLCYIIQAHMEMLGNGNAFVVARPPKDAFREAKANGFGVTVIRKGELQFNVDQPLEEVEDMMIEIGSKIYHDKLMKERSVDTSSLMKGLLTASKPTKRKRSKSRRKNPTKY
ncbi:hypothetical protein RJ641_015877 [Dillenia turbinata]|uniref:Uncharacterized protein n=1 Tax=Dillenia turbinata TaxID=194707 RepID=A0AAN8UN24_9MAGN